MELTDVLALVKAGYTRDEIAQMDNPQTPVPNPEPVQLSIPVVEQNPEPAPAPAQVVEPVAPAVPAPVPQPVQQQTQEQNQPTTADIMQEIAKLTSAIQANAIAQSVIPQGLTNPPSAENMLAEIIRPTFKGKE